MTKKGTALLITISIIALITIGISTGLHLTLSRAMQNQHSTEHTQCLLLADSGVERARWRVRNSAVNANLEPFNFAGGAIDNTFTVISAPYKATINATFPFPIIPTSYTTTIIIELDGNGNFTTAEDSYDIIP